MNEENAPKKVSVSRRATARIDIVSQVPGGPRRTSAAACVEPVLVEGIRASAGRGGKSISAFVRDAVEAGVRAEHEAAGLPWPPPASEQPALAPGEA